MTLQIIQYMNTNGLSDNEIIGLKWKLFARPNEVTNIVHRIRVGSSFRLQ
jgi:hypothetical protein